MGTGTPVPASKLGIPGGGLNINLNLGPTVAIQVGGHYMTRLVTTTVNNTSTYISTNAGLKFMLSRAFSLIVGGYYNLYLTNPMSLASPDSGASAGFGLSLPLSASMDLYISPMYHYAFVKTTYTGTDSFTPSELVGFLGIVIGGGSK